MDDLNIKCLYIKIGCLFQSSSLGRQHVGGSLAHMLASCTAYSAASFRSTLTWYVIENQEEGEKSLEHISALRRIQTSFLLFFLVPFFLCTRLLFSSLSFLPPLEAACVSKCHVQLQLYAKKPPPDINRQAHNTHTTSFSQPGKTAKEKRCGPLPIPHVVTRLSSLRSNDKTSPTYGTFPA